MYVYTLVAFRSLASLARFYILHLNLIQELECYLNTSIRETRYNAKTKLVTYMVPWTIDVIKVNNASKLIQ